MTRTKKLYAGVGNRGLLDMKAVLYKEQQEAEQASRDPVFAAERQSRRTVGLDVSKLKGRNQGVDQRNMQDMQHVKVCLFSPPLLAMVLSASVLHQDLESHTELAQDTAVMSMLPIPGQEAICLSCSSSKCVCLADSSGQAG